MAEYIDKRKAQMALCNLPATLDAEAVQRCIETVHNLPVANVRENVIRTQADRIRAMSDKELAKAFAMQCIGRECQKGITCADCWLDWLRQEVEHDLH